MKDRILSVAERLFYQEGIRAVGVDRVIAEAGIAKATLYRHFSAKDDLVEAYLRARHERIVEALRVELYAPAEAGARLLRLFDLLEEKAGSELFRGCAFLIAVAENESLPSVQRVAREHKQAIRALLTQIAAELPLDAGVLAEQVALCYEGALATIAVGRDPAAARVGRRCAEVLIEAALQAGGRRS